jgi:transcriptional regulator GlxA family with amidase domain
LILERLVEILLIAALRAAPTGTARPGLMRGLADPRIAAALRHMHAEIALPLTVEALSSVAGLSRSAFFERFARLVGVRPMEYLQTWRMSVARDLLRREDLSLDEVAERVGYGSASTFSTAFRRHVGTPPGRFARQMAGATAL